MAKRCKFTRVIEEWEKKYGNGRGKPGKRDLASFLEALKWVCKAEGHDVEKIVSRLCGMKIGSGAYRDVYVLKADDRYVLKVERDMGSGVFANVAEWRNWMNNREWKWLAEWLAPCFAINETGQVLIQERVTRLVDKPGLRKKDYPRKVPCILTDLKYQNFGFLNGRLVCCDYSFMPIYFISVGHSKMKVAKWWDGTTGNQLRKK